MPQGMRERRVYDGNDLLFDARDILDQKKHKGKQLVKMVTGPISYESPGGVKFWKSHPYQWVTEAEANLLEQSNAPTFVRAKFAELEDYYAY